MYFDRNATQNGAKRSGSAGMDRRANAAWVSPQAARADAARRLGVRAFRGPVGRDAGRRPALRCRAPSARSAVRSFAALRAAMPVGDRRSAVARHRRGRRYAVSRPFGPRCRSETGAPLSRAIGAVGGTQFRGPPDRDAGRRPALRCRAPSAQSAVRGFAALRTAMPVGDRWPVLPVGARCRAPSARSAVRGFAASGRDAGLKTGVPGLRAAVPD